MYRILITDSEERHLRIIKKILEVAPEEYSFYYASTPEMALAVLEQQKIDVFICELELPVMSGEEMFYLCSRISPETMQIALSPAEDIRRTLAATNRCGIFKFILKPCRVASDILIPVKEAVRMQKIRREAEQEKEEKRKGLEQIHQDYQKAATAVEERKAEYGIIMDMVTGFVNHNLESGSHAPAGKATMELEDFLRETYEAFARYYIFETRDWERNIKYLLKEFQNEKRGQFLEIENQVKGEMPTSLIPNICYALHMLMDLIRTQLLQYRISVLIGKKERRIVLLFRCDLEGSKDEKGRLLYRVTDRENFEKIYRGTLHTLHWICSQVVVDKEKNPYAINLSFEIRS